MTQVNLTRFPLLRKLSSGAAVGLLTAVFALLLPSIATFGASEVADTELTKEVTKPGKTIESRVRRTHSRSRPSSSRLRIVRRVRVDRSRSVPELFRSTHSLPNGLRAPLRC